MKKADLEEHLQAERLVLEFVVGMRRDACKRGDRLHAPVYQTIQNYMSDLVAHTEKLLENGWGGRPAKEPEEVSA